MMNELHAGLHARYLEERQEIERCPNCKGNDVGYRMVESGNDIYNIEQDGYFCYDCGEWIDLDVETFEEWAERNDIDLEDL